MGLKFELDEAVQGEAEGLGPSHAAIVDDDASPQLSEREQVRHIGFCTPGVGPEWARFFATKHAKTSDEYGHVALIPAYQYILDKCRAFEDAADCHGEKTRQMTISWTTAANHLGRTMFAQNAAGFITSRKEKVVDDGGGRSTTFSLVGKMRFIYEHLPEWMRAARPVQFSHLRVDCPATGSYVVGEGATGEGGRSGTFGRATVDEAAFMPGEGWFRAIRAACPEGLTLDSTPNGKANIFARLKFPDEGELPHGFRMNRYHWTRHPERVKGLYVSGSQKRSPWYDKATRGLTRDEIAREFDISYEHSVSGLVWPEYDEDRHVTWDAVFDPELPLYGGMDYGAAAATTLVLFQIHGREMWILADYEQWNADVDDHAPAIKALIDKVSGGRLAPNQVPIYGDPAGNARELSNKNSTVMKAYWGHGLTQMVQAPRLPKKDLVRLVRRKFTRNEVFIYPECRSVRRRIPDYRYRTDEMGNALGDVIVDNASPHICDAIEYGAAGRFQLDEDGGAYRFDTPKPMKQPIPFARELDRHNDRDAFRPIMSGRRDF